MSRNVLFRCIWGLVVLTAFAGESGIAAPKIEPFAPPLSKVIRPGAFAILIPEQSLLGRVPSLAAAVFGNPTPAASQTNAHPPKTEEKKMNQPTPLLDQMVEGVLYMGIGIGVCVLAAGLLFYWAHLRLKTQTATTPPAPAEKPTVSISAIYERAETLLNPMEKSFLNVLGKLADSEIRIFVKLRLSDLVRVQPETPDYQDRLARLVEHQVDFVLCDPQELKPMLVIELERPVEPTPERTKHEQIVDEILRVAGIPVLRFPAKAAYAVTDLEMLLVRTLDHGLARGEPKRSVVPLGAS